MKPSCKLLAMLVALGAIQVRAADSYWTNISSSTTAVPWTNTTAWSGANMPPLSSDRAIFGVTNSGTIGFGGTGWTITDVLVTNKIGSAGGTYTFLFNVANKTATVYNAFIIGDGSVAGQAAFRASGTGTEFLTITNNGNGKLIVGAGGNGTLTLASAAAGQNMAVWADQIIVGRDSGFTGTINQTTRTFLFASNLVVGSSGVGTLDQSAASTTNLISGQFVLGENNAGVGTHTLNNATGILAITNSGGAAKLIVGQNGAGNLTLLAGSLVVDNLIIATNAGSRGTFTWTAGSGLTVNSLGVDKNNAWSIFTNFITPGLSVPTQWGSNSLQGLILNTNLVGASLAHCIEIVTPKHIIIAVELATSFATAQPMLTTTAKVWTHGENAEFPRLDTEIDALPDPDLQLGVLLALTARVSPGATLVWIGVVLGVMAVVGRLSAMVFPGEPSEFILEIPPLRRPLLANVMAKTLARLRWYLREVIPLFVIATAALFVLSELRLLDAISRLAEPLVTGWLGLPREMANAFLVGFLRRDFGAVYILDAATGPSPTLSPQQILVAMIAITLFVPCIANLLVIAKEHGTRTAFWMAAFIFPFAFLVGGLVHQAGSWLPM